MARALTLRLNLASPGMVVADDVLHPVARNVLVKANTVLTQQHLDMLTRLGVTEVPITPQVPPRVKPEAVPVAPEPTPPVRSTGTTPLRFPASETESVVREVVARNASVVKTLDDAFLKTAKVDIEQVDKVVTSTLQEVVGNPEVLKNLNDLRTYDSDTVAHSANVMSLAMVVGLTLGYSFEQLRVLGVGALMHDLGQHSVPHHILNKPAKLSPQEYATVQQHVEHSLRVLKPYGWATRELLEIVQFHHEKYNGSGYPRQLKGKDIPEMAMIVGLCDVYDALISRRSYRQPMPPHLIYQMIIDGVGTHFAPRVVWAFQKFIVPYPANARVILNDDQVAKVLQVNRNNPMRPVVEMEDGQVLDLTAQPQLYVTTLWHPGGSGPLAPPAGTGPLPPKPSSGPLRPGTARLAPGPMPPRSGSGPTPARPN